MKIALGILWLLFCVARMEAGENPLVGRWAADSRTNGGLGAMLIFFADGTVTSTFGTLIDFKYRIDGDRIRTTYADGSKDTAGPYKIVGGNLIVRSAAGGKNEEHTRIGAAPQGAPPIVGLWSFKHDLGVATVEYTTNGLGQLSIPMQTQTGRFECEADRLIMTFTGQPAMHGTVYRSGNHLTLLGPAKASERRFTRLSPQAAPAN